VNDCYFTVNDCIIVALTRVDKSPGGSPALSLTATQYTNSKSCSSQASSQEAIDRQETIDKNTRAPRTRNGVMKKAASTPKKTMTAAATKKAAKKIADENKKAAAKKIADEKKKTAAAALKEDQPKMTTRKKTKKELAAERILAEANASMAMHLGQWYVVVR